MAAAEYERRVAGEQPSIPTLLADRYVGREPLTTRETVVMNVASGWLELHPEVTITQVDLSKTLQQLLTEVFHTGRQRGCEELSVHALSVLVAAGADPEAFASARTFSKSADMPVEYGVMFGGLAEVLAPLAAAIQLSRIPVADAAEELSTAAGSTNDIPRRELRGFVVAQVRPHAQALHASVGAGESADGYLNLILRDIDALAAAVVAAATAKRALPTELSPAGAERVAHFAGEHLGRLRRAAAARYGEHADDIVGATMLKLSAAVRNNPDTFISYPLVRQALTNSAIDYFAARAMRWANETSDPYDAERFDPGVDDTVTVNAADLVVQHVMTVADKLADPDAGAERALARETLLRYFLADREVSDPRRARLAAHVLSLSAPAATDKDDEVRTGLHSIAVALAPNRAAARRVTTLAITALRTEAE